MVLPGPSMMTRKPGAVLRGNTMRMAQVLNSARHRIPRNFEAHYEFESGRLTEVQVNFDWPAEERARSLDLPSICSWRCSLRRKGRTPSFRRWSDSCWSVRAACASCAGSARKASRTNRKRTDSTEVTRCDGVLLVATNFR